MYFTKNHYKKVIEIIRSSNDRLLKEASVTPGGLKKTIINLTSLLSKRIGKKFIGNPDVVFNVSKTSGNYSGVKYYMPDGSAIRFNWKMGSSATLDSVDFFNKKQVMPIYTFDGLEKLIPEIQKNEAPYIPINYFQISFDWLKDMFVTRKVIKKFDIRTFVNGLVKELYILGGDRSMWETIAAINIKTKYPTARFQIG